MTSMRTAGQDVDHRHRQIDRGLRCVEGKAPQRFSRRSRRRFQRCQRQRQDGARAKPGGVGGAVGRPRRGIVDAELVRRVQPRDGIGKNIADVRHGSLHALSAVPAFAVAQLTGFMGCCRRAGGRAIADPVAPPLS
jgi:hypothetical protein